MMEAGGTFGHYTVLAPLGETTKEVHVAQKAAQAGFARLVVIKSLFPETSKSNLAPHLEPARRAASLQHPNIRQIHELGSAQGRCFLAVEYLEGVTFDHLLRGRNRGEALGDPRLYAALLAQACEGMHHAHSRLQMVHGALRPTRLFVTSGGTVKILGLGLGDLLAATTSATDLANAGHYAYHCPEQILGRPTDARSDVFALGVIAWEALTGRRLFARGSRIEVYRAITEQPIPRPGRLARGLPVLIDAAVSRALAQRPDDRFRTAREFGLALEEGVNELGAPLSTVAIASMIDRCFGRELEQQRNVIQRARQQLRDGPVEDDAFDVPTSLFSGGFDPIQPTEQINAAEIEDILREPDSTINTGGQAASPYEPFGADQPAAVGTPPFAETPEPEAPEAAAPEPDPAPTNGSPLGPPPTRQRPGFARPPETLSDVTDIADVHAALGRDFEKVPTAEPEEAPPPPAKSGGRGWIIAVVLLLLIAAGGATGYYLWQQSQSETPSALNAE